MWWRLAIVPAVAWGCHAAALLRARRTRQNGDNEGLSPFWRPGKGRHDAP